MPVQLPLAAVTKLQNFPGSARIVQLRKTAAPWPHAGWISMLLLEWRRTQCKNHPAQGRTWPKRKSVEPFSVLCATKIRLPPV